MNKNKQQGFSALEGLLILVILGIIGFTGWYVIRANNNTNKALDGADKSNNVSANLPKERAAPTNPTAGWKAYSSKEEQFSMKYPSSWAADVCDDGSILLGATQTSAGKCQTDSTAQIQVSSVTGDVSSGYRFKSTSYPDLKTESVTINGINGTKQIGTLQNETENLAGPPNGTKVEEYIFYANGRTYLLAYTQTPDYKDVIADFDLMATKTLQFHP